MITPTQLKFYNLIKLNKKPFDPSLYKDQLPTPLESSCFRVLHQKMIELDNDYAKIIAKGLNPHNVPIQYINSKVTDVHYYTVKSSNIKKNNMLDNIINYNETGLYKIKIDETKSIFANEGIYDKKYIKDFIDILNNHFCKVTRLNNQKVIVSHLTHNPKQFDSSFIQTGDLLNKHRAQYQSKVGFELDENMIDFIQCVPAYFDKDLCNKIINEHRTVDIITEESFFHYSNNGMRDLSFMMKLKIKYLKIMK